MACAWARRVPQRWLLPNQIGHLPRAGIAERGRRGVYVSRLLMEKQRAGPVAGGSWLALREPRGSSRPQHYLGLVPPGVEAVYKLQERRRGRGGVHPNTDHPAGVTQCLALGPGAQLFCCMPSPDWGIRGCELWDLGVSQEESGGPSLLHLEPPFLVLEAKASWAVPAVFTDTSSVLF